MLLVKFVNITDISDISNYAIEVFINSRCIWRGEVRGHNRNFGWAHLVKRFVEQVFREEKEGKDGGCEEDLHRCPCCNSKIVLVHRGKK